MTRPASEKAGVTIFAEAGDFLGESPLWSTAEQALYWIDVRAPALRRKGWRSAEITSWPRPEIVGTAMLRARGGLVLGLKSGLHAFAPETGKLDMLVPFDEGHEGNRLNDAKVDRRGRIWCTTMWDFGRHATGSLYRVDPDLTVTRVRSGITVPNAVSFSPDGRRIYFADTPVRRLEVAELDADGLPGPWRVLSEADSAPGNPDGATVDADGYVWNARYGGGVIARFSPDGGRDRLFELPVTQPSSCAFGGPDLTHLFVTTSRQGLTAAALAAEPLAGAVLTLEAGVAGIAEPAFAG